MAADEEDDMELLLYEEQMQYPKTDEDRAKYEFPELETEIRKEPEFQLVGRSFPDNVDSHKHQSEALHVRCRSPRRSASHIIWRHMPTICTTQDASVA